MSFVGLPPSEVVAGRGLEMEINGSGGSISIGSGVLSTGDTVRLMKVDEVVLRQQQSGESRLVIEHGDHVLTARHVAPIIHLRVFNKIGVNEIVLDMREIAALRTLCEEALAAAAAKALAAEGTPDAR